MKFLNKRNLIILVGIFMFIGFAVWLYKYERAKKQTEFFLRQAQELQKQVQNLPKKEQENLITATTTTPALKIYRNEEFGFEFQYLSDWEIKVNIYRSPASKFNLIATPSRDKYLPDPVLINITTPEFASRAFSDLENIATEVVVGGVVGKKYEYEFESMRRISIILPFGKHQMILGAEKQYKDIFNQVLATFKFLKQGSDSVRIVP